MAAMGFPCFLSKEVRSNTESTGAIKDTSRRVNVTLTMTGENHRRQRRAGYVVGAFAPFPRSTWIHPHVPRDDFDRVCKVIWARAKKCEERFGRGRGAAGNKRTHRADEQQGNANGSSENAQREEEKQRLYRTGFTLPCPYLSGRRRPCAAKSARAPSPVMEEKMELSQEEAERRGDVDKGEQQHWKIWAPESRSQSINYYDPTGETSESVDEQTKSSSSDGREETGSSHTLLAKKDFPPLSAAKRGLLPLPTGPPASGKLPGQWEAPPPFHPRNIPADALASAPAAPAQAPVQGGAGAPRAASTAAAPPAARAQRRPYDLLADFPALQPPTRPLGSGNPKSRDAAGKREIIHQPNDRQESEARNESRVRNGPHEVSSICVRDQRSELNPRNFGISCKGTDGAGVNARSWACAAKAGMKQAAAPQERARPCSFQQIVTINRAKAVNHNTTNKVTQSSIARPHQSQGVGPLEAGSHRGPGSSALVTPPSQQLPLQQCFSRRQRLLPFSVSLNHRKTKGEEFLA